MGKLVDLTCYQSLHKQVLEEKINILAIYILYTAKNKYMNLFCEKDNSEF